MNVLTEIYQFLFISSIIFIIHIVSDLMVKMYGRFKLNKDTKFILTNTEKVLLWISVAIFFTYIY